MIMLLKAGVLLLLICVNAEIGRTQPVSNVLIGQSLEGRRFGLRSPAALLQ